MADTYKGESLGKKVARGWFWVTVERWLGDDFYTGKHLVFASREGGDVAVLKAMGVPARNIVAMEINPGAAAEFASRHPDVRPFVGDAAELVNDKRFRGQLVSAHLDFCSWFTDSVVETAIRVARFGMRNNGLLTIGVMKGRERGEFYRTVKYAQDAHRAEDQKLIEEGVLGRPKTAAERSWHDAFQTSMSRAYLISWTLGRTLERDGPICSVMPFCHIGYNSGRTPMLYATQLVARNFFTKRQMFGSLAEMMREAADRYLGQAYELASKEYQILATPRSSQEFLDQHPFLEFRGRFRQFGDLEFGLASPELATIIAGALEQMVPRSPPAALLNLRPGRLAAWRAHATRGTYDARKAG